MEIQRQHRTARVFAAALAAATCPSARADWGVNLTPGVTPISHTAYHLHMMAFWVCVAIGVVVFGALAWALFHHRKSKGAVPATFHENTRLEILWTIIPFFILVALAVPATQALVNMDDTSNADLTVKVTGHQWRWRYDYLDQHISFFSDLDAKSSEAAKRGSGIDPATVDEYLRNVDNPLVLPVGKKIRFLFTSADVIHAWWVPALGYQVDSNPGFVSEAWARIERPGIYRGQCAELCGVGHAYMPIVLVAMNDSDFDAWVRKKQAEAAAAGASAERVWTKDELMAKGKEVYEHICVACHQPTGLGIPGVFPALKGSAIATGPVAGHMDRVMNGKPGTAMQAFAKQLSDVEIAGVITYERNSFGNSVGDLVQPAQIKMARK